VTEIGSCNREITHALGYRVVGDWYRSARVR